MLKRAQALTGAIFASFILVHLLNTWSGSFGPDTYNSLQGMLRSIYQTLAVELILLSALAVHIVVGLLRIRIEPRRVLTTRAKIHRYTGFFLLAVIGGHIFAVRGPSWLADVYPEFTGVAFAIDYLPWVFYPYYFALAVAGLYHCINGLGIAAHKLGVRASLSGRSLALATSVAAGMTLLALLNFGGVMRDIDDPNDSDFARLALEFIGQEVRNE